MVASGTNVCAYCAAKSRKDRDGFGKSFASQYSTGGSRDTAATTLNSPTHKKALRTFWYNASCATRKRTSPGIQPAERGRREPTLFDWRFFGRSWRVAFLHRYVNLKFIGQCAAKEQQSPRADVVSY